MVEFRLAARPKGLPQAFDRRLAAVGRERWIDAANAAGGTDLARRAAALAAAGPSAELLDALFGNSPYLTLLVERDPAFAVRLLQEGAERAFEQVMLEVTEIRRAAIAGADPSAALRLAKRRIALLTAVADIAGTWSVPQVTEALSRFADRAVSCAAAHLLANAARRDAIRLPSASEPEQGSGLIVLGMGKLGAYELNFSSDIDLIIFYDPERIDAADRAALQPLFDRLTRHLVKMLSERTAEGYVFRTDLRLRPDPGSTPPAMTVLAAEVYYETMGQNWERAAMIKARPIAGDTAAAVGLLDRLRPYVWRKNLDFAAIADIHSIKRQINAHRGGGRIGIEGHNIKIGRGGIREIEFFAQTQQLIWGGRIRSLRVRGTIEALDALARSGKISASVAHDLASAYYALRRVEHRLQMINDEQTHELPEDPGKLGALATFLGYDDASAFREDLLAVLRCVESHYAELFEDAPALVAADALGGSLVFTGGEADPETLATLTRLGFANPLAVDAAVRGWHHGRPRAMRSARARELLTELMPTLLQAVAGQPDPDAAFLAFDQFLSALPAGVQLFSMFHAHPDLLRLVTDIAGIAPRLGERLAQRPSLLDSVLTPDFLDPPPPLDALRVEIDEVLAQAHSAEEALDLSRRWAGERRFQVGVQELRGLIQTPVAALAYSNVAEAAVCGLKPRIEAEFAVRHGTVPGCGIAVVALGKLGGREMTATSDLDLIFVYETPAAAAASTGPRPLSAPQYFARLSQALINALTAPTAEGQLYAVDMRLRPSGKAGPIAVSFESFERYQREQAWTWEQMALTRARVIAGPPALAQRIEQVIFDVLTRRRDPETLVADVAAMRARMAAEHRTESLWDIKHLRGGLVDVEFIAQYLQLLHAHEHPQLLSPSTGVVLRRAQALELLPRETAQTLIDALAVWQAVQGRQRVALSGRVAARGGADAPKALRACLTGVLGLSFPALVATMEAAARDVSAIFEQLIAKPASQRRRQAAPTDPAVGPSRSANA